MMSIDAPSLFVPCVGCIYRCKICGYKKCDTYHVKGVALFCVADYCLGLAGNADNLACINAIGILNAVELDQLIDRYAIALGNLREGIAALDTIGVGAIRFPVLVLRWTMIVLLLAWAMIPVAALWAITGSKGGGGEEGCRQRNYSKQH